MREGDSSGGSGLRSTGREFRGCAFSARHRSCRAKRCDRRERVLSGCAAESRHLLGPAGTVRECWVHEDVSTSALRRRASGRHDVLFSGTCFSRPPSGPVERNAGRNARAGGKAVILYVPSPQDTAPPRQSHSAKQGLQTRRRAAGSPLRPRPPQTRASPRAQTQRIAQSHAEPRPAAVFSSPARSTPRPNTPLRPKR